MSSVGSFFSYVNDARSHEPEACFYSYVTVYCHNGKNMTLFQNMVRKRMFWLCKDEIKGGWRELHI